jgi:hypothetical protein
MLGKDFNPYSKSQQLKSHQKQNDTPKYKERRYNRKKKQTKKVDYKGVNIPSRHARSEFTDKHKKQIIEYFGGEWECAACQDLSITFHHIQFRSCAKGLGRNNPRNGVPLCHVHHDMCHKHNDHIEYAQSWRDRQIGIWGPDYYKDAYDIWKEHKIERPTEELMNRYFERERERIAEKSHEL